VIPAEKVEGQILEQNKSWNETNPGTKQILEQNKSWNKTNPGTKQIL
jgi:hypothetical protein